MTNVSSKQVQAERMNRDEQNLMAALSQGLKGFAFSRAQMATARRLARKGLVTIGQEGTGRDAMSWVRRTDWKELEQKALEA